ncbi:kinase-like partial [Phaffia rhodozyma]|uniref:Kinase-like partial n=1 Tax=Phaffia rhodozyma TaxID=264483 RepID=A0A0F7SJY2_PHARH|nr:kinase-like partial [Phaffia rhodozyma]
MAIQEGSLPITIPCSTSSSNNQYDFSPSSARQESYSSVLSTGLLGPQAATNVPSAALCDQASKRRVPLASTGSHSSIASSSSSSSSSAVPYRPRSYSSFGPGEHVHPPDSPNDHQRHSPSADLSSLTTPTGEIQLEPVAISTRASFLAAFSSFGLPPLPTLTIPDGNSRPAPEPTSVEPSPASSFLSSFSSPTISSQVTSSSSSLSSFSALLPSISSLDDFPVFDDKFIGRILGKGSTGSVREVLSFPAKERLSPPQAVKIVLLPKPKLKSARNSTGVQDDELATELETEISLWASLPSHPNILPLLSSERTQDAIFLFMPYMVSGSLFDLVRRHREHDRGRGRRLVSSFRSFSHASATDRSNGQSNQTECAGLVGVGRSATLRESGVGGGLRFFPEDDARKLFRDIVAGLQVLHREGIVHGDLKSENVLVDEEGHCKLSDFGFSHRLEVNQSPQPISITGHTNANTVLASLQPHGFPSGKTSQNRQASSPLPRSAALLRMAQSTAPPFIPPSGGSMPYTAPELLQPVQSLSGAQQRTTLTTDMWALGVLLHFLLTTGSFPFQDAFEPRLQMKILRGVWSLPEEVGGGRLGREAESLLKGLLEVQVDERWTVDEVGRSEWLAGWAEVRKSSRSRSRSRTALGVLGQTTRRRSKSTHRSARIDENPGGPSSPSLPSTSYQSASLFGSSLESFSSVDGHQTQANSWSDQTYLPPTPHQSLSPPAPHQSLSPPFHHSTASGSTIFPSGLKASKSRSRSGSRDTRWRRRPYVESAHTQNQPGQRAEPNEGWGTLGGQMIVEVEEPARERREGTSERRSRSRGRRREANVD